MYEQELIILLTKDDRQAFNRVYDLYARKLMLYCLSMVHCREDAEDLVQDVFISLWRNRRGLRCTDSLSPYLYSSLRKRVVYYYRSRLNSPVYEDYILSRELFVDDVSQKHIEYEEFFNRVMHEINQLPLTQRRAVTLSKIHGMSNAEIADKLNLNIQTVKNAVSTGLKTLRSHFGPLGSLLPMLIFLNFTI